MEERVSMTADHLLRPAKWAGLVVAAVLLAACATSPLPSPSTPAAVSAPSTPPVAAASAPALSAPGASAPGASAHTAAAPAAAASAATRIDTQAAAPNEPPEAAAGAPRDPLRPDAAVAFDDEAARRDLWQRIRRGFAINDLDTDLVRDREQYYASRPDYVQRMTDRGGRYLFHIVEEVEKRGMPTELALLPFIESAFNPTAMSSARASGIWQFMPSTGRHYRLKQNIFRDDRRDVLASTRAALDYLSRLYDMFGDWHLALAAYNWGEGNVQRAIARNRNQGLPADYLSLAMPAETRQYVPKLQAVKNIVARPETFALTLPPLENHPYFIAVPIERDIDVALATRLAGLSVEEFKTLNPSMNKPVILAAGTPQVLLPYDNAKTFLRNLKAYKGPLASWTAWTVPRTMKTAHAASMVGVDEGDLREINRIPPRMLVKAGSTLLVPRGGHRLQDVSEEVADNASMALAPDVPPVRRVVFKARRGETVASIAKRYRLSAAQVAQWNRTHVNARFAAGQAVAVFVPVRAARVERTVASAQGKPKAYLAVAKSKAPIQASPKAATRAPAKSTSKAAAKTASKAGAQGRAKPTKVAERRGSGRSDTRTKPRS
jgi:membrane-bound lytic murein transglycosylase D